ncbi:MAG: hypothetical protein JWM47_201 [Acidimicrobiales bacterium]|nr:hypothetical protein [Acidimicrobiales bacterium]
MQCGTKWLGNDRDVNVATSAGVWHVRRRWAPRHLGSQTIWARFLHRSRKVRRRAKDAGDLPDPGCAPDVGEGILVFIVLIVVVLFLIFIGIPFLIALGELLFIVVLTLAGIVGRLLFRRPWTIDAVGPNGEHHAWPVVGWRASGVARQFIADRITATRYVPTSGEVAAAVLSA